MARPVCFLVDTDAEIMGTYYKARAGRADVTEVWTPRVADDRGIADDCNIELGKALDVAKPGGSIFSPGGARRRAAGRGVSRRLRRPRRSGEGRLPCPARRGRPARTVGRAVAESWECRWRPGCSACHPHRARRPGRRQS